MAAVLPLKPWKSSCDWHPFHFLLFPILNTWCYSFKNTAIIVLSFSYFETLLFSLILAKLSVWFPLTRWFTTFLRFGLWPWNGGWRNSAPMAVGVIRCHGYNRKHMIRLMERSWFGWFGLGTKNTWLGLGKDCSLGWNNFFLKVKQHRHGYSNKHADKVVERARLQTTTFSFKWETDRKSPVLKSCVLPTHLQPQPPPNVEEVKKWNNPVICKKKD